MFSNQSTWYLDHDPVSREPCHHRRLATTVDALLRLPIIIPPLKFYVVRNLRINLNNDQQDHTRDQLNKGSVEILIFTVCKTDYSKSEEAKHKLIKKNQKVLNLDRALHVHNY